LKLDTSHLKLPSHRFRFARWALRKLGVPARLLPKLALFVTYDRQDRIETLFRGYDSHGSSSRQIGKQNGTPCDLEAPTPPNRRPTHPDRAHPDKTLGDACMFHGERKFSSIVLTVHSPRP
jgi:hypothetical protein